MPRATYVELESNLWNERAPLRLALHVRLHSSAIYIVNNHIIPESGEYLGLAIDIRWLLKLPDL